VDLDLTTKELPNPKKHVVQAISYVVLDAMTRLTYQLSLLLTQSGSNEDIDMPTPNSILEL
jgi:hypothetical protein